MDRPNTTFLDGPATTHGLPFGATFTPELADRLGGRYPLYSWATCAHCTGDIKSVIGDPALGHPNPVTLSIAWVLRAAGIPEITADNAHEVWARTAVRHELTGMTSLSLAQITDHIGLRIETKAMTRWQWSRQFRDPGKALRYMAREDQQRDWPHGGKATWFADFPLVRERAQ